MTHTLAAVFETRAEATHARNALQQNGFDASAIQVHDSGSVAGTARINDDASILGNVKQMFSELFGRDHADQHVYAEALNRGHSVLSLETGSLAEAERAADIIDDFNPIDIDEHESMWRASGWGADVLRSGTGPLQTSVGAQQAAPEQHGIRPREDAVVFARSEQVVLAPGSLQRGDVVSGTMPLAAEAVADIQNTVQRSGMRIYPRDAGINQDSIDILTGNEQADDDYFRSHWEKTYTGGTYQEYDPAYRYGESMKGNPGYRDKEWNDIEPDLRASWESKQPQSSWDKFKDAVKHGWERITS
ncbi:MULTISPECIES: hypothetical protein [unclassified Duganella]|uniref:hypothetical protein n=1 Tax=unclassified Duganella TaxID=2636909 RepID=UPI0008860C72|nr:MULTISPECIES: hypothetical protein [unclassified Duganella]SDH49440.1 hypothetical protein SAMN05216320_11447 [Duganella sp. OV458]SDK63959.1 hypothetical protein SAMN05428973_11453 [Duganella sp. OV510]